MLWISSNILTYPMRSEKKIVYHELVKWAAREIGVDQWILGNEIDLRHRTRDTGADVRHNLGSTES